MSRPAPRPSAVPRPPDAEAMTKGSVFEGLFVKQLRAQGAFLAAVKAAGYDPERPQAEYPLPVWKGCIEAARQHVFPQLSRERAHHELGRVMIAGFFETLVGAFVGSAFTLLGPGGMLRQLHRFWARGQPDVRVRAEEVRPGCWNVLYAAERELMPHLICGTLEGALQRTGAHAAHCEVLEASERTVLLRASWDVAG